MPATIFLPVVLGRPDIGVRASLLTILNLSILLFPCLAEGEPTREEECHRILHSEHAADHELAEECRREFFTSDQVTLVVTPSRRPEAANRAAASVSVVKQQELQRTGSDSAAEALRKVPGVQITDAGQAGLKRVRIRGEESRRVAILIDGQEFVDQREVGTPLLLAPEMIEQVEVVRGTGSVLHGSRAIGGVVNFITKKGGYHPLQSSASALYDSATDGYNLYGSLYGGTDGWEYRASAATADHEDRTSAKGKLDNTAFDSQSLAVYLGKNFGAHSIGASFDQFNASSGVYVEPAVATAPPFNDFRIDAPRRDRSKVSLSYEGDKLGSLVRSVQLDGYYQISKREFNTLSDLTLDFGNGPLNQLIDNRSDSDLDTFGMNAQARLTLLSAHDLVLGIEAKNDALDQSRTRVVTTAGQTMPGERTVDQANQTTLEGFAEDVWQLSEGLELRAGARGIYFKTELEESTREGLDPFSESDTAVVGAAGLRYSPAEDVTIWTGWSQGFVSPSLVNLATGAFAGASFVNPNSDLKPERSNSFDLGIKLQKEFFAVDLSVFITEARDYIDHVLCSSSNISCIQPSGRSDRIYDNVDEARTFGSELSASLLLGSLRPYLSASWIRRRYTRNAVSTYDTGLPALYGRGGLEIEKNLDEPIGLWLDGYVSAATEADELDGDRVLHTAGWGTLNVAMGATMGAKRELKLSLELLNLGDKFYKTATENIPARGRSAIFKVQLDL